MTRDETKKIIMMLAASYHKGLMPEVNTMMVDSWHAILSDLDFSLTAAATAALISTHEYPPTIAAIRGKVAECQVMTIPAEEAFSLIREAVRKFGNYRKEEAAVWLGEKIWRTVERYTWEYFCQMNRENITTYAAQFRRAWEGEAEYERQMRAIPAQIRAQLDAQRPKDYPPCMAEEQSTPLMINSARYEGEET